MSSIIRHHPDLYPEVGQSLKPGKTDLLSSIHLHCITTGPYEQRHGITRDVYGYCLIRHSQTEQTQDQCWPNIVNLEERHTHERKGKEKPQRLAFEAGNLPSSGKQSAFMKRDSRKRNERHRVFPLLKDPPLGRGELHQPFSLSFRGRKDMTLCLSRYIIIQ